MSEERRAYWFSVSNGADAAIVLSYLKEMGIDAKELTPRRQGRFGKSCGPGFGDMVWRVNSRLDRIEASFSRPCATAKQVKALGFRWDHSAGVWYGPNTDFSADQIEALGLKQVDHVASK